MDKCTPSAKDYSSRMGTQDTLWFASFKKTIKNGAEFSNSSTDSIKLGLVQALQNKIYLSKNNTKPRFKHIYNNIVRLYLAK